MMILEIDIMCSYKEDSTIKKQKYYLISRGMAKLFLYSPGGSSSLELELLDSVPSVSLSGHYSTRALAPVCSFVGFLVGMLLGSALLLFLLLVDIWSRCFFGVK